MKCNLLLLTSALLLAACNNQTPGTGDGTATTDTTVNNNLDSNIPIDTLHLGNKTLLVYTVSKALFDQYPSSSTDTTENVLLAKDSLLLKRNADTLLFSLTNGQTMSMVNKVNQDDEDYAGYTYAGYFPAIHRLGVIATYYESGNYLLVNPANGDTLHTWGAPVVSPDKKYLLCTSMDLAAGFVPNGFQLFSYENDQVKMIGEIEINNWGPGEVKWMDRNTLLATYIFLDNDMNPGTKYVKIVLQ